MATKPLCSIPDCDKTSLARGLCPNHYQLWRKRDVVRKIAADGASLSFATAAISSSSSECIVWPYAIKNKYPSFTIKGRKIQAHRFVCEAAHGEPPEKTLMACHGCGNCKCVNPGHLYWGTAKQNQDDRLRHGTDCRGVRNPLAKLTEDQARIAKYDTSRSVAELASAFKVRPCTIYAVREGKNWKHI